MSTVVRVLVAVSVLAAASAHAQPAASDPVARREAMQRLAFIVGEWSGDARMTLGPGRTENFRQTERVRFALGGQVLVIDGIGRTLKEGSVGDTAFQAFGVLDWRPDRGYQLRSMTHEGREGTFAVTPLAEGQGFVWGFEVPGGRTRYTIRLTPEGEWHERGEFSRDGQQWIPTMEMRLRRVAR
jgi:hypothetical protein